MKFFFAILALFAASVAAFTSGPVSSSVRPNSALDASKELDVAALASRVEELELLSKVADLGVLSKIERAGLTLSQTAPLLKLVDEQGLLYLLEDEELVNKAVPLLPTLVEQAPKLLPLAGAALKAGPTPLYALAAAGLAAGAAEIALIPDDSVASIALQAFLAVPLLAVAPAAGVIGGTILSKLK
ncbi:unnamed protein product [Heterosigma akashiwo]|mmetsp:Transcript_12659/g.17657  ORF Transcript_12659/g.17657 Transcript_12659/m.17657 type:complete len:186 (+) Transcript_12659:57-614(+)|eukprot:CAMPEP_0194575554 /NCGR_PEP_ID=MMETSP0292-20121207/11003_1 /TAXON_ID=39354 /ORGANISM="Heterosigma akashiwo, Strain CCMP2393" /LENGTH=185 /DNA_ID=CAMNT_0039427387 /DNA_START=196 /DNA_END=753 /DNA_ORIENTATION=+